jgi:hypothetical protein
MPAPAQAWRDDGHYITCHIAMLELSREVRAEVARLIALDASTQIFEEACIWADDVKYTTHRESEPWHYFNAPPGSRTVDMDYCTAERGCLLSAIETHVGVLADHNRSDIERMEALKYLGHWLGDVHQPLHFGLAANKGGNDVHVLWQAAEGPISPFFLNPRETNMHRVWDHEMLDDLRLEPFRFATRLWMSITAQERSIWADSEPLVWAQESLTIATDPATKYAGAEPGQVLVLGREYLERHFPTVEKRLKMGGIRLGHLLNLLLSPPTPKS